jgi:uncharacterized membrane protein YhhN
VEPAALVSGVVLVAVLMGSVTILVRYAPPDYPALDRVTKPLTTLLILVIALLPGTFFSDRYAAAICLGLIFSTIGDYLLLPPERFLRGMGSFLLALSCYAVAFFEGMDSDAFVWTGVVLMLVGQGLLATLRGGLRGSMRVAVGAYMVAMVFMVALAIGLAVVSPSTGTLAAAAGALLLLVSDSLLAIDRFGRPFHLAHLAVLGTYYVGQLLIALSVGMKV